MSLVTVVQLRCASCGRQYGQQVHQAIDAAKEPHLKQMLLQGRLHLTVCPQCGNRGPLTNPLLYHDPEKSLFLMLQPMDLRANAVGQQQVIGRIQSQFMDSLKPEERRGYMLSPKIYLSLQSMVDDIMIADGITREEIEAARERTALLEQLIQSETLEDLQKKVDANRDKIDYAFFETLTGLIEQTAAEGNAEATQALSDLRDDLLGLVEVEGVEPSGQVEISREELLQLLSEERDPDKLRQIVALARPALDYPFFQAIAERIEAAEQGGDELQARRLSKLRETILQTIDEIDQEAREALGQAAAFIREALGQRELESHLRANAERLDDAFFAVLNANIAEAQRRNDERSARALATLGAVAVKLLEEKAPPELRLINQALRAEPDARRELLLEHRDLLNETTVALIDRMGAGLGDRNGAMARELQAVRQLIEEIIAQP